MTDAPRPVPLRFFGVLFLTVDGLLWWLAGASQLPMPWLVVVLGLIAAVPLLWYGRKLPSSSPDGGDLRPYPVVVGVAQVVAVAVAAVVVGLIGVWPALPGLIAVVHGVGWLLLRRGARPRLGVALMVIGVLAVLLGVLSDSASRAVVMVGLPAAAALWCVPAIAMVQQFRTQKAPPTPFHLSDLGDDQDDER